MKRYAVLVMTAMLSGQHILAQTDQSLQGLQRPPEKLKVTLTVDGIDNIFVQGNELWIVHERFEFPSDIKINGRKWDCQWSNNTSDRYTKLDPIFLPRLESAVELHKSKGRGGVQLSQKPSAKNGFTAIIRIADLANASDKYEFALSWDKAIAPLAQKMLEKTQTEAPPSPKQEPIQGARSGGSVVELQGHRYQVYGDRVKRTDAESICQQLGGHLASVDSEDELVFIQNYLKSQEQMDHWISATVRDPETMWIGTRGVLRREPREAAEQPYVCEWDQ